MVSMLKKTLIVSTTAFSLILSGCSATVGVDNTAGDIPLTEDYNVSSMPSWAPSSMELLEKDGWQVSKMDNMFTPKEGQQVPAIYVATNKDNTCSITYITGGVEATDDSQDSYALTAKSVDVISFDANNKINSQNTDAYIHVDNDARLQLLSVDYTRTLDKTKQNNISAFRVLSSPISSPYNSDMFASSKIYPKIEINYSCSDKKLDMSLWNKVLDSASVTY